jgi:alpha-maltose-1-phosphate synthase
MKRDSRLNRLLSYFIRCSERMAARYSDRIVAVTPQIGSYLREEFNCPREKVVVISNGVNTDVFRPLRDEALFSRLKSEMRIPPEGRVVVFVGNLAPWQGVDDLIHVANSLILRIKDIYILIVGDGVLKKKYEEEVTRLGLSDRFLFKGMVHHDQIPIYINLADVCLVLKKKLRSGYSPIKLCEYLACGKPVVASRVEGLEFIETENLGRLVEPGDMRELENVLVELLTDHGKRTEMGRRGLLLARDHFSWDSKTLEIENLLRKLA